MIGFGIVSKTMKAKRLCSLFAVLLLATYSFADSAWKPLFDGQTFDGWTFDVLDDSPAASIFSISDGVLNIEGAGKSKAVIQSKGSYSNFELEFEWLWPAKPGNSGCLLFCSGKRFMSVWPKSLEVQMQHGSAGDFIYIGETIDVTKEQLPIYDKEKESWKKRLRLNLTDDSEKTPGQWNHCRIISNDGEVTVYVNGDLVNKGWNATARSGRICFQAEFADVQYRNIRILETATR